MSYDTQQTEADDGYILAVKCAAHFENASVFLRFKILFQIVIVFKSNNNRREQNC